MTGDEQLREELRRVFLFAVLEEDELNAILATVSRQELAPGETLFAQDDPAGRFFWLRRGLIKLTRLSPEGEEKVVELIRQGQTFGEAIAFMDRQVYPVNAEAIEPSEVIGLECGRFRDLLHGSVDACFRVMAGLSTRLHQQIDEIDRLTLQNATTRVVAYLLDASKKEGAVLELGMPKHLLASRLSIQPETLSRIFARLSRSGMLRVEGQKVVLLDEAGLRRQAGLH